VRVFCSYEVSIDDGMTESAAFNAIYLCDSFKGAFIGGENK
jgi:hypothetical protein